MVAMARRLAGPSILTVVSTVVQLLSYNTQSSTACNYSAEDQSVKAMSGHLARAFSQVKSSWKADITKVSRLN